MTMRKFVLYLMLFFVSLGWVVVIASNGIPFKPVMSIRLERCTSYCNPKYCKIKTVCRPLNRTSKFIYMDIDLHPGVKFDAPVNIKVVTLKQFATVYRPHMINFKTELCKELAAKTHPLLFAIKVDKPIFGNLFNPCPFTGRRSTTPRITNIFDFVTPLVPIVPAGQWRIDIIISVERNGSEIVVVSWNDYYEIKTLTAEEF